MSLTISLVTPTLICLLLFHTPVFADSPPESGFLSDYSRLESPEVEWLDYVYMTDDFSQRIASAEAIIIAQPEIFLAPDSKYKGMKPTDMQIITESMRQLVVEAFADGYQIAYSPGPNTVTISMAFTNLYLKKKPRTPGIGWLPQVYLATSAKRALLNDFTENILLTELVWEAQITNSETGEILGEILLKLGERKKKKSFTSWDELTVALSVASERFRCRFDNASLAESARRDCLEITEADIDFGE